MSKDYYKILGVEKNATQDEIKKAFRKLAHEHHPDKKGGNEAKFKEANEAYGVLSDEKKRAQYDQFGSAGAQGFGGQGGYGGFEGFDFSGFGFGGQGGQGQNGSFEFDLGDIFGSVFGGGGRGRGNKGPKKGQDIQVDIELSFTDSIFGTDKDIQVTKNDTCSTCKGTRGEPGSELHTCGTCHGKGQVVRQQRSVFGMVENVVSCEECLGTGKIPKHKCKTCKGKGIELKKEHIQVLIPPGIETGESLRVRGKGEAIAGGEHGDLYIRIHVKKDPRFKKSGYDLYADLPVSIADAVLGGEARFEHLNESFTVKIPESITHGEILRIKGKGVPHGSPSRADRIDRGDLMLKIVITIPRKLSKEQRKLFEQLRLTEKK